jgi:hypothetical protein
MIASLIDISDVPACVCMMKTSHRLAEPRPHLAVREVLDVRIAELDVEVLRDLLGERQMSATGVEDEPLLGDELHRSSCRRRPPNQGSSLRGAV